MTKTLLVVLAHPDDESFGMGGTIALYARKGYDVYYICATRGEVGSADPEFMQGYSSTAEMRTAELMGAAKELGLKEVFFLDYRDSGMLGMEEANKHPNAQINHPIDEVAGRVVKYIRELKVDVVVTFDPIGGYRHPDHIHIHQATVLAFQKADDASFHPEAGSPFKPKRLYFHTFQKGLLKFGVFIMRLMGRDPRKFGRNKDIDILALVEFDFPTHVKINISPVVEIKRAAGAWHASQGGRQMNRGVMGIVSKLLGESEGFMQAYPPIEGKFKLKKDLFEGIE